MKLYVVSGASSSPLFGSLKSLLLRGFCTPFLCWGYFWQGVNAQIAVLVTMEKLSHRKAYALFSEDGQTLNLPSFLLTCSSEVHFVPVVFRLKIPLAHTCFLLGFAIFGVLTAQGKDEESEQRGAYPESLHITREMNVVAVWLWVFFERELARDCLGGFWYILMYVC